MLERMGLRTPPCGVPLRVALNLHSSKYPAFKRFSISRKKRLSWIFSERIDSRIEGSRLPKHSEMSPSTNQVVPLHLRWISESAVWHPRPGLKPCDRSLNCGS